MARTSCGSRLQITPYMGEYFAVTHVALYPLAANRGTAATARAAPHARGEKMLARVLMRQ
jgi:hypothetical protein